MNNSIRPRVFLTVNSLINLFQENPYDFLAEMEIQASLYSHLKTAIKETIQLPVEYLPDQTEEDGVASSIVRAQYPLMKKFDIAIIHPNSRKRMSNDKNNPLRSQDLLGAIQLELYQAGDRFDKKLNSLWWSMNKLHGFANNGNKSTFEFGLALLFVQTEDLPWDLIIKRSFGVEKVSKVEEGYGIAGYIINRGSGYRVNRALVSIQDVR